MKKICSYIIMSLWGALSAQDIHFSQFYSVPVLINPAEAGRFREDARFTFIHRRQWVALNSAFNSTGVSTDFVVLPPFMKKDNLGLGIYAANDNIGQGTIKGSSVNISLAYHAFIDKARRHRLSAGIQGGFTSKAVDDRYFQFYNQYADFAFVPDRDAKEQISGYNYSFFDGQGGLFYTFVVDPKWELNFGTSAYQLHQPKETVFNKELSKNNKLGTRSIYTLGARYKISPKITLSPQIMYMRQSKAKDWNLGAMVIYTIPHSFPLQLQGGIFHRTQDAAIFLIGTRYKALEVRYSYDLTTSSARDMRGAQGATNKQVNAHEFVINFYGKLARKNSREFTVPCGIF
jgi:type IX secretion system PorP/SprF family membrane protein